MMPVWAARLLAVVLFFAIMAGWSVVLKAVLPVMLDPVGERFGWWPTFGVFTIFMVACGIYGFWPRDRSGRMRPLLRRR